jgi:anti-sigma B factor antagonist
MELRSYQLGTVAVIAVDGRFDNLSAVEVTAAIERAIQRTAQLIVDLTAVPFLDSTALATLVRGMRRCRERGGDLYLAGLQQPVYMIFDLTRLNKAFSIYVDAQQAAHAFALCVNPGATRV